MKKNIILLGVLVLTLVIVSCSNNEGKSPSTPFDVVVNNQIISYGMSQEDSEKVLGNGEVSKILYSNALEYNKSIKLAYTSDIIRCIEITDSEIVSYNKIKVGSAVKDMLKQYQFEQNINNCYVIAFSGNQEVNVKDLNSAETVDCWITYFVNNDIVEKIQIYDSKFAKEMR